MQLKHLQLHIHYVPNSIIKFCYFLMSLQNFMTIRDLHNDYSDNFGSKMPFVETCLKIKSCERTCPRGV